VKKFFYYPRNTTYKSLLLQLPYIVASRTSESLIQRLLQDNYPVVMEGVHCTHITNDERFRKRKMFVRIYNVENEYYEKLYQFSKKSKHKIYYWIESKQLYKYEKKLSHHATAYWPVAEQDADYYRREFNCKANDYLPLFIPPWAVNGAEGMGAYCLYHGNLEVEENEYAVAWLIKNVFKKLRISFVVAGKNPSKKNYFACKKI